MKKGLGKGLDALIPRNNNKVLSAGSENSVSGNFFEIDLLNIIPNDNQPRTNFDEAMMEDLVQSIGRNGVIQPIIVTKVDNNKYMIIEGERRWRASGLAGKKTVPAVVRSAETPKERLELALITNLQREDLNPVELAKAYKKLMDEHNYRHEDLGIVVGKSRSAVTNRLRLLNLPEEVLVLIENKKIEEGHARALLGLKNQSDIIKYAELIANKNLSVRDVEKLVKITNEGKPEKKENIKDPNISSIEKEMEGFFNSKVNIKTSDKGGVINIKYNSDDELDTIIKRIRGEQC